MYVSLFMERIVFIVDASGLCRAAVNSPTCVNSDFPFCFLKLFGNVDTFFVRDDPFQTVCK
jgi:hypothetical protein